MTARKARQSQLSEEAIIYEPRTVDSPVKADDLDDYLADIIGELEQLARAHRKELLAYLLSMASVQASVRRSRYSRALH